MQATGDVTFLTNATADMQDILNLEMLPEGKKGRHSQKY